MPLRVVAIAQSADAPVPVYWWDSAYDSRLVATATNSSALPLYEQLLSITVPDGVTVDADSLRVVEMTALNSVDRAYDWRYGVTNLPVNHFWTLPASLSGSTVTVKTIGKWAAGETRYFGAYWDSTSTIAATSYNHLNGISQAWTHVVTAGSTGNTYRLIVGGVNYTHTMTGGQTASDIATALRALINAGVVGVATGTGATIFTKAVNPLDTTFTVTNTGTTTAANLTVVKPNFFGAGRIGPDLEVYDATNYWYGYPYHNPISGVMTAPGFGRATGTLIRLMNYSVNGVGVQRLTGGTITSIAIDPEKVRVAGTLTYPVRSSDVDWSASYTAVQRNIVYGGRKSDDTGAETLMKLADAVRVTLTYTCARVGGYTPTAVTAGTTAVGTTELLGVTSTGNFNSNVTEAAGNKLPFFTAPLSTGVISQVSAAADLSALSVTDTIMGAHSNVSGMGVLVNSISLTNFGSQSPEAKWATSASAAYPILHLRNLSTASVIPQGATVTLDFWIVDGLTRNASATGDNLLPDELVAILRGLTVTPSVSVTAEDYQDGLAETIALASEYAVEGITWFQDNALALTATAGNYAYTYNVQDGTLQQSDDDDGNYGEAYKLAGLCLRYLRTHDAALVALINAQAGWHVQIEQDAVADYGTWWQGSAPFWYWASTTPSSGSLYLAEGGVTDGDCDPNFNSGVLGPIIYNRGDIRRQTSIDQIHMVALGLYHYLYLLRNESAITANTTLRTNVLALLSRMATFEAAHFSSSARICGNLYALCSGGTPSRANGITDTQYNDESNTTLADPYWGTSGNFLGWQVNNTDGATIAPSSNITLDDFFRALFATGSSAAGVERYLKGAVNDMACSDVHHHDVTFTTTNWNTLTAADRPYPIGWMLRATATGNAYKYSSGRTGDDHFLSITSGVRDAMSGRAAQRLGILCLCALFDPDYAVPVEMNSTTPLRTVALRDEIDELARSLALYLVEPTTHAQRMSASGHFGRPTSGYHPKKVDSAFTGYAAFGYETWHLVNAGADIADYYPIGAW